MARGVVIAAALVGCVHLAAANAAQAAENVTITAAFTPNVLGSPTNASGSALITSTVPGALPTPVTGFTIKGPAGLTINPTGTTTCSAQVLEAIGPSACPKTSVAGIGGGVAALQLGQQVIEEAFTLNLFLGNSKPGHLELLLYVNGVAPASVQLVFTAPVVVT